MNEPNQTYLVESLEQLRSLSDSLRLRILEALAHEAHTITQLGDMLGEAPAKMLYHVRELERVGLVRLVEKREKGGNLEKYYRAVSENIQISPTLLHATPADEVLAPVQEWMRQVTAHTLDAALRSRQASGDPLILATVKVWLSPEEAPKLMDQINALLEGYRQPRGGAGEREWDCNVLIYSLPQPSAPAGARPAEDARKEE